MSLKIIGRRRVRKDVCYITRLWYWLWSIDLPVCWRSDYDDARLLNDTNDPPASFWWIKFLWMIQKAQCSGNSQTVRKIETSRSILLLLLNPTLASILMEKTKYILELAFRFPSFLKRIYASTSQLKNRMKHKYGFESWRVQRRKKANMHRFLTRVVGPAIIQAAMKTFLWMVFLMNVTLPI